jgi:hypothetical protein
MCSDRRENIAKRGESSRGEETEKRWKHLGLQQEMGKHR